MIILGIDPGIERTGYALIEVDGHKTKAQEFGCITTSSNKPIGDRLVEINRDLEKIISECKPHAAVVERLVFVHNVTSALAVGQARGVIVMTLHRHKIPVSEYAPTQVKQAVTSNGAADKQSVGSAVKLIFGLKSIPQPDDAADALALALCHAGQVQ